MTTHLPQPPDPEASLPHSGSAAPSTSVESSGSGLTSANLRATFDAYVDAESAAASAFLSYSFGEASEAEVHRLQQAAAAAMGAHLAQINRAATFAEAYFAEAGALNEREVRR